ncbi:MAG: hypothetical protein QF570_09395 [Myxococcota bacterium]|jgi:hypothetical protein|nr:hypothetical protein [Myxococcota bacterium]
MPPRSPADRSRRIRARLTALLVASALLPLASPSFADSRGVDGDASALFERARTAKRTARAPLLPQTRYTVRKQIESIEPVSWLERFGKVQVRELKR